MLPLVGQLGTAGACVGPAGALAVKEAAERSVAPPADKVPAGAARGQPARAGRAGLAQQRRPTVAAAVRRPSAALAAPSLVGLSAGMAGAGPGSKVRVRGWPACTERKHPGDRPQRMLKIWVADWLKLAARTHRILPSVALRRLANQRGSRMTCTPWWPPLRRPRPRQPAAQAVALHAVQASSAPGSRSACSNLAAPKQIPIRLLPLAAGWAGRPRAHGSARAGLQRKPLCCRQAAHLIAVAMSPDQRKQGGLCS